nr:hypothetical protein [Clostridia bacterium]
MTRTADLSGEWTLYYKDALSGKRLTFEDREGANAVPAEVPGNVEPDLARAGVLPDDLFFGMNTTLAYKTETWDFLYERTFDASEVLPAGKAPASAELVFDAVDCAAEYWLNGEKIGSSRNAFIPQRFPVVLRDGENTVSVLIRSA